MGLNTRFDNDPVSYLNKGMPDKDELAMLLLKAKGVSRNMAEFADACGTSASTFSRIANKKITQPVAADLLVKIAENADPEANIQARDLFLANGMELKEGFDGAPVTSRTDVYRNPFYLAHEMKNIIVSDLISRGNMLSQVRQIDDPDASRLVRSAGQAGLILRVEGSETEYWKFRMMDVPGLNSASAARISDLRQWLEERERGRNYEADAVLLLSRLADVFLEDVWYPEKMNMCKVSFVFRVKAYYDAFNELIKDHKFNNWFSSILLDMENRHVIDEFVFLRYTGNDKKSPLDYPILPDEDDGFTDDSFIDED